MVCVTGLNMASTWLGSTTAQRERFGLFCPGRKFVSIARSRRDAHTLGPKQSGRRRAEAVSDPDN
jgi:hypothetical protein